MTPLAAAQRWTLRVGVFLLPLVYSPATYDGYVLPKLLFARVLVVALLVLWLARIAVTRTVVLKRTPLDVPFLLFLASAALSWVFAENRNVAWLGTYERYDGLLTLLTYAALFWLAVQSLAGRDEARSLARVLLAGGYVVAAVAALQSVRDSVQHGAFEPAYGTMGNPNVLGAFLALVITLAAGEALVTDSVTARILLVNVLVVGGLALLLSFSRSGWFGAVVGVFIVVALRPRRAKVLAAFAPAIVVLVVVILAGYNIAGPGQLERDFAQRVQSVFDVRALFGGRTGIWGDSVRLIASRPLVGYGPDNVGLVFPRFQTGDWGVEAGVGRQPIDKAHADLLQIGATQGLIGVATYLLLQLAFLRTWWRARHIDQAAVMGAAWIAFQVVVQLNFTALAAAMPFWIFAAAAVMSSDAVRGRSALVGTRVAFVPIVLGIALAAVVLWRAVAAPYLADERLREAVDADFSHHPQDAQRLADEARRLAPWESVYSVEIANVAFEQNQWAAARDAYRTAAELGTFNDLVYRNLALADMHLGLNAEAHDAARHAVELNRFDPANQALLAEFATTP